MLILKLANLALFIFKFYYDVHFFIINCSKNRQYLVQIAQNSPFSIGTKIADVYVSLLG